MRTRSQSIGQLLAALAAALPVLLAWGGAPAQGPRPLVVGLVADPLTLDAHAVADNNTRRAVYPMFDPLVRESADKTTVEPALAERWEMAPGGRSWTLHLRRGVRFHDGTPFNAEAVKFNLERQFVADHPNHKDGNWLFFRLFLSPIEGVDVVDEYTIRIRLKQPYAPLLDGLTGNPAYMISPKSVRELGKGVGTQPVGTGPFKIEAWERGKRLVLGRNADYWGDKAKIDRLIFVPIADPTARLTALTSGQVDLSVDLTPDVIESVRANPDLAVAERPSRQIWGLQMSTKFAPFADKRVRQAVSFAIDRRALTQNVLKGTGVPARSIFSEVFGGMLPADLPAYPYEPARARALLAAAGHAGGFDVTLTVPSSGSGMQQPVPMAEFIQSNLGAVGIRVKLEVLEWGAYVRKWNTGTYEMSARGITSVLYDPDIYLNALFNSANHSPNGLNSTFWKNEEYDRLANATRSALDPAERLRLAHQAQRILLDEAPWAFVDHEIDLYYLNRRVDGFRIRGNFLIDFNRLSLRR